MCCFLEKFTQLAPILYDRRAGKGVWLLAEDQGGERGRQKDATG